jgi:hypothetical protein
VLNLTARLKRLEKLIPRVTRLADPWPGEWAGRLALSMFDAHAATFNATGDDELAARAAELWVDAFLDELRVNPDATRPRLSVFKDDGPAPWPAIDGDDDPDTHDPAALDQIIAQATRDREIHLSSVP